MANISVSYDEMERVATTLATGRDEIMDRLRSLEHTIQNLVSTGFVTDSASKRFEATYGEYSVNASGVIDKLTEIQNFIVQTAQAHREMDSQLAARLG